jgi:hypothetical protein
MLETLLVLVDAASEEPQDFVFFDFAYDSQPQTGG